MTEVRYPSAGGGEFVEQWSDRNELVSFTWLAPSMRLLLDEVAV